MRVIAVLALVFGFGQQLLLDGQVFAHAVYGIVCGAVAVACGLASARRNPLHRWEGRLMAGFGFALGVWCMVMLPSAYRFQEKFNGRREERQRSWNVSPPPPNSSQQILLVDFTEGEKHIYGLLHEIQGYAILTESLVRESGDAKVRLTLDTNKTSVASLNINLMSLARKQDFRTEQ